MASGFITDAGPQFLKVALNSRKVTPRLKTALFEGVRMIFGLQFFSSAYAIYVECAFCKRIDQILPNMTGAAAQRKHCHVWGVTTLYPVSAHSNKEQFTTSHHKSEKTQTRTKTKTCTKIMTQV